MPRNYTLKGPSYTPEEVACLKAYIKARRAQSTGELAAKAIEEAIKAIVAKHGPITMANAYIGPKDSIRYGYPDDILGLEQDLKDAKERAKSDGTARQSVTHTIEFRDVERHASKRGKVVPT